MRLLALLIAALTGASAADAPTTSVRGCGTRAEPSWRPASTDTLIGPVRSAVGFYEKSQPSAFASRADQVGFQRYINGSRGKALSERKRRQLLRLAPSYYNQLKTPVAVPAGRTITLTITRADRPYAAFMFTEASQRRGRQIGPYWSYRVSDGTNAVRFTACRRNEPMFSADGVVGPWTGFPGAMVVAGARCVTIEAKERGRPVKRRRLGFGASGC
jgi:hypothetical protein